MANEHSIYGNWISVWMKQINGDFTAYLLLVLGILFSCWKIMKMTEALESDFKLSHEKKKWEGNT